MSRNLNKVALVDTCFWFALLNPKEVARHSDALSKVGTLRNMAYILPWPILYETLNTTFIEVPERLTRFDTEFLKSPNAEILDDCQYRELALKKTLTQRRIAKCLPSLVDNVLREIIADKNVRITCLFTYNKADFADVCGRRRIEMI